VPLIALVNFFVNIDSKWCNISVLVKSERKPDAVPQQNPPFQNINKPRKNDA
jgi:hypothetical protein